VCCIVAFHPHVYMRHALNCFSISHGPVYLGCNSEISDLVSLGGVTLQGNNFVEGHIYAASARIGDCTEVEGDVGTVQDAKFGEDTEVEGNTGKVNRNALINFYQHQSQDFQFTTPSQISKNKPDLVVVDEYFLDIGSKFNSITVLRNAILHLVEGEIQVNKFIVEHGAVLVSEENLGSTISAFETISIGNGVTVVGTVNLISANTVILGRRVCGTADSRIERRREPDELYEEELIVDENELRKRSTQEFCECGEPVSQFEFCYCRHPAQVNIRARGSALIGAQSSVEGSVVANTISLGSSSCLSCD